MDQHKPSTAQQVASRTLNVIGASLEQELEVRTRPGKLWSSADGEAVRCYACAHRCFIQNGSRGACGVRFNRDGVLQVPFGYVARRYVRPVETNTILHVLPGARALTFGMFGCDLRCPYCHNHRLSQALRDGPSAERPVDMSPDALVEEALRAGCSVICGAYNEPMITAEWGHAVFEVAKRHGLKTALISDGNSTREALEFMRSVTDVFRVDLKAADDAGYHRLGGRISPVLESIRAARELGYWVEVVTLVVPGLNQDLGSIRQIATTLAAIDPEMPWHLNGFVPRYKLQQMPAADPFFLSSAAGSGYAAGMRYVYVGNLPGRDELCHTRCPSCHQVLIRRQDYATLENELVQGRCRQCGTNIPGLFS
ncbi:MAG TPA: radical SAM protein [Polyangiaceae bacterium]|nr:radical SAM protein [Polyangiaceae bacterium]